MSLDRYLIVDITQERLLKSKKTINRNKIPNIIIFIKTYKIYEFLIETQCKLLRA